MQLNINLNERSQTLFDAFCEDRQLGKSQGFAALIERTRHLEELNEILKKTTYTQTQFIFTLQDRITELEEAQSNEI